MNANDTIKRLMRLHGVTYAEMGRRLGKSEKTVAGMMRPGRNLTERTIHRLAAQLGYEPVMEFRLMLDNRPNIGAEHMDKWMEYASQACKSLNPSDAPTDDFHEARNWVSLVSARMADERLAKELEDGSISGV